MNDSPFNIYERTKHRRVTLPQCENFTLLNVVTIGSKERRALLKWLDKHTTGKFYLGFSTLEFELEQDAIMYQLGFKG